MELRLPLFFSPKISTTVRFALGLARQRLAFRVLAPLAPRKAGDRARRLFLTPPRHGFRRAELEALEEASLFTVSMPTGRLIGWRWGRKEDPVVVLVHGWGGRAAQLRGYVAPLLARGYSVVAFDARLIMHRYAMLGILDENGYPTREMGILEAPREASAPKIMQGALCKECGNYTVIRKDGCDFCSACGAVGACG